MCKYETFTIRHVFYVPSLIPGDGILKTWLRKYTIYKEKLKDLRVLLNCYGAEYNSEEKVFELYSKEAYKVLESFLEENQVKKFTFTYNYDFFTPYGDSSTEGFHTTYSHKFTIYEDNIDLTIGLLEACGATVVSDDTNTFELPSMESFNAVTQYLFVLTCL